MMQSLTSLGGAAPPWCGPPARLRLDCAALPPPPLFQRRVVHNALAAAGADLSLPDGRYSSMTPLPSQYLGQPNFHAISACGPFASAIDRLKRLIAEANLALVSSGRSLHPLFHPQERPACCRDDSRTHKPSPHLNDRQFSEVICESYALSCARALD